MGDMDWKWNCCTIYFPNGTCQLICLRSKKKKLIMYNQATKGRGLKFCNLTRCCTVLCCFNIPWTPREETSVSFIPTSFKNPICKFKVQKLVIRSSLQVVDVNSSYYKKVPSYNVLVSQFGVNQLSVLKNNIFSFLFIVSDTNKKKLTNNDHCQWINISLQWYCDSSELFVLT